MHPRHSPARRAQRALLFLFTSLVPLFAAGQPQEMPKPAYAVGDRWAYRETDLLTRNETGRVVEAVHSVAPDALWLARTSSKMAHWVRVDPATLVAREQWAASGPTTADRGKTTATNDGGCAYPWPLKIGQTFDCTELTTWANGWTVRYELKFTVEGAETLEVGAGKFDTLRLVAAGHYVNETNQVRGRQERTVWLAPVAKREVRQEIRSFLAQTSRPNRTDGRELVEFTAGAAP
jgi:hypothetical protein